MALTPPPARRGAPPRPITSGTPANPPATQNAPSPAAVDDDHGDKTVQTPAPAAATSATATDAPESTTGTARSALPPRGTSLRGAPPASRSPLPPRGALPPTSRTPAPASRTPVASPPPASPAPTRTAAVRTLPPAGRAAPPVTRNAAPATAPQPTKPAKASSGVTGERRGGGAFVQPQTASIETAPRPVVFVTVESGPDVVFGVNGEAPRLEDQESALHPIRSIMITIVRPDGTKEDKTFTGETGERDGVAALLEILNTADENALHPRLVTYGGRNKLFPRLYVAAMLHGLKLGIVRESPNRHASYQTRFNTYYHLDLADQISHYGASRAPALHALAAAVGGQKGLSDMESLIFIHDQLIRPASPGLQAGDKGAHGIGEKSLALNMEEM